jgi:hypothetical protein
VSADRPINADVGPPEDDPKPAAEPKAEPAAEQEAKPAKSRPDAKKPAEAKRSAPAAAKGTTPAREKHAAPAGAKRSAKSAAPAEEKRSAPAEEPPLTVERRRRIPGALKLVAALVLIAIGFIALAVFVGKGSKNDAGTSTIVKVAPAKDGESFSKGVPIEESPAEEEPDETSAEDEATGSGGTTALGYPTFATSNTTRIGGPDPVANAAAASLAVFPAMSEKQRPVAVSLVNEEDWAGAVAAAVLMAEPIRAPLLYGEAEGVPGPTGEALDALQPGGGAASGGAAVFAIGGVEVPGGMRATKIQGGDAASEAAAIASLRDRLAGSSPKAILLASSSEPAFAAPAAAYAARSGDPVLFTEADHLPEQTAAAIRHDEGVSVYALGPGSAISNQVLKEVEKLPAKVHRISGADPVATAIAFARFGEGKFGWNVNDPGHGFVLARSDAPLEAAAAAPLSASGTWGPLLLTDSADTLPSELRGYFLDVKPGYTTDPTRAFYNHVWIVGDAGQISVEQQAEVNEVAELAKIGDGE